METIALGRLDRIVDALYGLSEDVEDLAACVRAPHREDLVKVAGSLEHDADLLETVADRLRAAASSS